jgi:hypothetical protein
MFPRLLNLAGRFFHTSATRGLVSLKKVSPGLLGFDTIFTGLAAGSLQRRHDLLMLVQDVWVAQKIG